MKELNITSEIFSKEQDSHPIRPKIQPMFKERTSKSKRVYTKRTTEKIKRWTSDECKKYEQFILQNNNVMNDSSTKRTEKIFLSMAHFIGTKTPSQCRSHHQKFSRRVLSDLSLKPNFDSNPNFEPNQNFQENSLNSTNEDLNPLHYNSHLETQEKILENSLCLNLNLKSNANFFAEEEQFNGFASGNDFLKEFEADFM